MSEARAAEASEIFRLTAPFERPIEPVRVSPLYRLGLACVAIAMMLLPLIYLALVVAVGWGLFWHATENVTVFQATGSGRGALRVAFFSYVVPLVIGSILLLFMIKPIFARRPKPPPPIALEPADEPTLFAFVNRLCAALGAARPRRIHVDFEVNASASFRRGWLSMLGNDLVLTIGLPLVAGMTLRQFTGVLAHEFGHFAQGTGMRVTCVIRAVNHWFARVVYERDAWDVTLDEWAEDSDWKVSVVLHIARFFVWLIRRILWALMTVGHALSCFMLRQMEYDADRYEVRVSGSEVFESTVYRLQALSAANQQAWNTVQGSWRSGRLADDMPALVAISADRLPDNVMEAIKEHVRSGHSGAFDTHPSDLDRIESARRENSEGVFRLQDPAASLFHDFAALSRRVTASTYSQHLDREMSPANLVPTAALIAGERELDDAMGIVRRYFNGSIPSSPPLTFSPNTVIEPTEGTSAAYRELERARQIVEDGAADAGRRNERFRELDQYAIRAFQAFQLIEAGFRVNAGKFGLPGATAQDARSVLDRTLAQQRAVSEEGAAHAEAARRRIVLSLRLAHQPEVRTQIDNVEEQLSSSRRLLDALACLGDNLSDLDALRRDYAAYSLLIQVLQNQEAPETATTRLYGLSNELLMRLDRLRKQCDALHPLESETTIGAQAIPDLPDRGEFGAIGSRTDEAISRIQSLRVRTLAALVKFAAQVEAALGLPPLPEPPEDRPPR